MNTRLQIQRKTTPKSSFTPLGRSLLPHRSTEQAEPPVLGPILHDMLPKFQAKLTIGQPNDQYEQEADRVAEQVMRMPEPKIQMEEEEKEKDNNSVKKRNIRRFREELSKLVKEEDITILVSPGDKYILQHYEGTITIYSNNIFWYTASDDEIQEAVLSTYNNYFRKSVDE